MTTDPKELAATLRRLSEQADFSTGYPMYDTETREHLNEAANVLLWRSE